MLHYHTLYGNIWFYWLLIKPGLKSIWAWSTFLLTSRPLPRITVLLLMSIGQTHVTLRFHKKRFCIKDRITLLTGVLKDRITLVTGILKDRITLLTGILKDRITLLTGILKDRMTLLTGVLTTSIIYNKALIDLSIWILFPGNPRDFDSCIYVNLRDSDKNNTFWQHADTQNGRHWSGCWPWKGIEFDRQNCLCQNPPSFPDTLTCRFFMYDMFPEMHI